MLIPQYPFGYCSANEIDLQFQYRYANQVRVDIFQEGITLTSTSIRKHFVLLLAA